MPPTRRPPIGYGAEPGRRRTEEIQEPPEEELMMEWKVSRSRPRRCDGRTMRTVAPV
jgi:hypothetical protein